jgi:hypothetical protein
MLDRGSAQTPPYSGVCSDSPRSDTGPLAFTRCRGSGRGSRTIPPHSAIPPIRIAASAAGKRPASARQRAGSWAVSQDPSFGARR